MTAAPVPDYEHPQPDNPAALEFDFAEITAILNRLSTDVPARLELDDTPDAAVLLLNDLTVAWRKFGEIKAYAESVCVKRLRYGRNEVAGFVAEVKGGHKRTEWRHDEVAWAAVRDLCADPSTGEIDPRRSEIVGQVRDRLLNCARPDWRVTALRTVGVDPSAFCTTEPGRKSVVLTAAVDAS